MTDTPALPLDSELISELRHDLWATNTLAVTGEQINQLCDQALLAIAERQAREALAREAICDVCLGQPLSSGRECICCGFGTLTSTLTGTRQALFDARQRAELAESRLAEAEKVLQELMSAHGAQMPPFESGKEAQDAWADRRAKARNDAADLIAALHPVSGEK